MVRLDDFHMEGLLHNVEDVDLATKLLDNRVRNDQIRRKGHTKSINVCGRDLGYFDVCASTRKDLTASIMSIGNTFYDVKSMFERTESLGSPLFFLLSDTLALE